MKNFQYKRGWRNILQSRPVLGILAILALVFAWNVFGLMNKMSATKENRQMAENKVKELEQEKEKLSGDIANLKTDEGVEASIREKFGLAKEGEGVIVIVDDPNQPKPKENSSGGFWSFFTNWFK